MSNKNMMVTCRCGLRFDLAYAPWCKHKNNFMRTKECPKGHCICHKFGYPNVDKWRTATENEKKLGFTMMLKEEYGGVVE